MSGQPVQQEAGIEQLRAFLQSTVLPRGADPVTAAADLCAHARIAPNLRNAALNLVGSDLYKKVKPPGDTSLYTNSAWSLESLADVRPSAAHPASVTRQQLSLALALPAGRHVLPEASKGPRVLGPSQKAQLQS